MTPKVHLHDYLDATPAELAALPNSIINYLVLQARRGYSSSTIYGGAAPTTEWSAAGPLLEEMAAGNCDPTLFATDSEANPVRSVCWLDRDGGSLLANAQTAPRAIALAYLAWKLEGFKAAQAAGKDK